MIDEIDQITSMSQERLYKWLHSFSGLVLDYPQSTQQQSGTVSIGKRPTFTFSSHQVGHILSTKSIVQRIWQRLISAQILTLQIDAMKDTKLPMPELQPILFQQIEEFKKVKCGTARIKSFYKVESQSYRLDIQRDQAPFELIAQIKIQDGYPEKPCLFDLSLVTARSNNKSKEAEKQTTVTKFYD